MLPEQVINNFDAYRFTYEEALPQAPEAPPPPQLSLFARAVRWIDAQTSAPATILKILTFVVLALSLVGIILLYRFRQEQQVQEAARLALEEIARPWKLTCDSWNKVVSLVENLGGEAWFDELPFYEDEVPIGQSGYLDLFKCYQLNAPIMKGRDQHGRAFVAFRIKRIGVEDLSQSFVCTFFQRYRNDTRWAIGSGFGLNPPLGMEGLTVDEAWCQKMRGIIGGTDTEYELDAVPRAFG